MASAKKQQALPGLWSTQAIQTPEGLLVSGVMLRKPARPLPPHGSWWATLRKTIRTYFLQPYSGNFWLQSDDDFTEIRTDSQGGFQTFIKGRAEHLSFLTADRRNTIEPLHSYPHRFDYSTAKYLVVSDIDDTILVSKSSLFISKLWLMLFRQTSRRNFVEETEQAYRRLMHCSVPFAYLSASEYNLFSIITNFITFHDLPVGPVLLRPFQRWDQVMHRRDRKAYKVDRFDELIAHFPKTRIILFGDDSQHDPQVFAHIMDLYPDNIHAVFLRQTGFVHHHTGTEILKRHQGEFPVFGFSKYAEIEAPLNNLIHEITTGS